ncbi:MAG TPA: hypothetical protein DIW31_08210 [Bacteroidales bacterium]|nr:hypothetical protein [Bacteroidales bacterium]
MLSIFQIKTIAHFEAKTLFRSWFFRILGILMLTIVFFYNLATVVFGEGEIQFAVPSTIPYSNLMFFNVVQAIIAVFLASDFLKRDKKLDTTEVIYTRSMSNGDYVIGKLLGNVFVFTTLNVAMLGMALIFNLILGTDTVNWIAYIYYFLLISIPTLIFIIGLSFILMNIIKNQAVTFAILIGYIFLTMFYLKNQFYHLFDYMVYNIPMLYSDIIGFTDLKLLIIHRAMYLLLGLSFIALSVYRLWRLPNKPYANIYPISLSIILFVGAIFLGSVHVKNAMRGEKLRQRMMVINDKYSNYNRLTLLNQNLKLNHKGNTIDVDCSVKGVNQTNEAIDTIILSLNPSLFVSKLTQDGKELQIVRKEHLILIKPNSKIEPNDSITINISYNGKIDDEACYIDIDEKTRAKGESSDMVNIGKIYNYVSKSFVLLTPESNWYPKTSVGFNKMNTLWMLPDFYRFNLSVTTTTELTAISQGEATTSNNTTTFVNETALPGLSLVIGKYKKVSFNSNQPEIGAYIKPNHDFFNKVFKDIKDTTQRIIYSAFEDYSLKLNMPYPYKHLLLVEVPMQVFSHQRFWANHMELMQPELIFVQEKGGQNRFFTFERNIERNKKWGSGKGLSDKELQVEELKNFLSSFTKQATTTVNFRDNQIKEEDQPNPYYIYDNFFAYNHPVVSKEFPIINTILGSYLTNQTNDKKKQWYSVGFSEDERAVLLLQKENLTQIMLNPDYYSLADNIIKMKGDVLLSLLEKKAGKPQLDEILKNIFMKYKGKPIPFDEINNQIKEKTGQDFGYQLNNWLKSDKLPGFRIGEVDAYKVTDGEHQRYLSRISIGNDGDIEGIVKIAIREESNNNDNNNEERKIDYKAYEIGVNQVKTLSILSDKQPSKVIVSTNAAMNVPVKYEISILKVEGDGSMKAQANEKTTPLVQWDEPGEIVVDNEDSCFHVVNVSKQGLLIKVANKFKRPGEEYQGYMWWMVSGKWGKYVNYQFYGKYLHSAESIRSGGGNAKAIWNIPISNKGQYDIYTFIPRDKAEEDEQHLGEYHYTIHHDDGENKVTINCKDIDGWVLLGTYYCSPGNTTVELNNQSNSRVVIADAVKAVKL